MIKKKISLFAVITFIFMLFTISCKKENVTKSVETTQAASLTKIKSDLQKINAKYALGSTAGKTTHVKGADAWAVGGADLAAAVGAGISTWSWCATPIGGFFAGLVITGSAAVASYVTYRGFGGANFRVAMGDPTPDDPLITQQQKDKLILHVGTYVIPNPHSNPYEGSGIMHNELVKKLCMHSIDLPITYNTLAFSNNDLTQDQLDAFAYDELHIGYNIANISGFVTPENFVDEFGNLTCTPLVNYYLSSNPNLQSIVPILIDGLKLAANQPTAMALINDYEDYFMNTPTNLTNAEKAGILHGLAVGKYSYTMWADALN